MVGRLFVSFWGREILAGAMSISFREGFFRHGFFCFKKNPVDVEDIAESDAKGLSSPLAPSALHVLQKLGLIARSPKTCFEASTKVIKKYESSVLGMHRNFM